MQDQVRLYLVTPKSDNFGNVLRQSRILSYRRTQYSTVLDFFENRALFLCQMGLVARIIPIVRKECVRHAYPNIWSYVSIIVTENIIGTGGKPGHMEQHR